MKGRRHEHQKAMGNKDKRKSVWRKSQITLSCFSLAPQTRLPKAALDGAQEAYAWLIQHPLISCSNFGGIIMALFWYYAPNTEQQTSLLCEEESRMRIPMAYSFCNVPEP